MSHESRFRKTGLVIFDNVGHDDSMVMSFKQDAEFNFDGKPAHFMVKGNQLDLENKSGNVIDVAAHLINLTSDLKVEQDGFVAKRALYQQSVDDNRGRISNEVDRASSAEAAIADAIAVNMSDSKSKEADYNKQIEVLKATLNMKKNTSSQKDTEIEAAIGAMSSSISSDLVNKKAQSEAEDKKSMDALNAEVVRASAVEAELTAHCAATFNDNESKRQTEQKDIENRIATLDPELTSQIFQTAADIESKNNGMNTKLQEIDNLVRSDDLYQEGFINDLESRVAYLEQVLIQSFA